MQWLEYALLSLCGFPFKAKPLTFLNAMQVAAHMELSGCPMSPS